MWLDVIKEHSFILLKFFTNVVHWIVVNIFASKRKGSCAYEDSAEVCKIWLTYKPPERLDFSSKEDFLYSHVRQTHPDIIMKDEVSLYTVTAEEAIFVNCGEIDVFDSKNGPFVYNVQFAAAVELIILPISSFHKVANYIPLPQIPLVHLANHGRCGSTLLSNVFEAIPKSLSISELNAFTSIAELSRKENLSRGVLKRLCFSVQMCMLKHANSRCTSLVFFKCQNVAVYITDLLMESLPAVKHVYMYRQPVPFVRSYEKLFALSKLPPLSVESCKLWSGIGHNELLLKYPVYPYHFVEELSLFAKIALIWISGAAAYNELISGKYPTCSLKFEDFLSDPKKTVLALFNYAGIPDSYLPDIETVMSKDSQAGTAYSSRGVDKKKFDHCFTQITDSLKSEVDKLCYDFNVPLFWNDFHLTGRI